jgi:hypothetical protein
LKILPTAMEWTYYTTDNGRFTAWTLEASEGWGRISGCVITPGVGILQKQVNWFASNCGVDSS